MKKLTPLQAERGYDIIGMTWQWEVLTQKWIRRLIRRWRRSKTHDWSQLFYVDPDLDEFCMRCLSQDVVPVMDGGTVSYHCGDCDLVFRIIPI